MGHHRVESERESKSRQYLFDSGRSEWYQRLSQGLHHRAVMGPFSGCSGLGTAFNLDRTGCCSLRSILLVPGKRVGLPGG